MITSPATFLSQSDADAYAAALLLKGCFANVVPVDGTFLVVPITLPLININGTGAKTLFNGYLEAADAVGKAIVVVMNIEFHARDYTQSGQDPEVWKTAVREHESRMERLKNVREEFLAIAEHVVNFVK